MKEPASAGFFMSRRSSRAQEKGRGSEDPRPLLAPMPEDTPPWGASCADQKRFSTDTLQVRGMPGTPVTTPREFDVTSLTDRK